MLMQDAIKEFVYECEVRKYTKRTIKGYKNNNLLFATYVERELGIVEVEDMTHVHIKHYFSFLVQKKFTETYINGLIKCFRAFFKYCLEEGYIVKYNAPIE